LSGRGPISDGVPVGEIGWLDAGFGAPPQRAMLLRVEARELRAEEEYLRRIVHPQRQHAERSNGAQ
jgi:hypothetical protein